MLSLPVKKIVLFSLGGLICLYSIAVLSYVPSSPDIGIHCSFNPIIKRVTVPNPEEVGPAVGDNLVQVGKYRFPEEMQPHPMWAQVRLLRELIDLRNDGPSRDANGDWVARANPDGGLDVLVKFKAQGIDQIEEVWLPLSNMPVNELVPSILWFFLKLGLF